jgi:ribosomal-protein-alanine N-acetyltransferase
MLRNCAIKKPDALQADSSVSLRPLTEEDLPIALAIEQASFLSPWTRAAFLHELHSSHSRLVAAEWQGQVIGYLCAWFVVDEVHILDVAVHPTHRRQGVGKLLLQYSLQEGQQGGAHSASLEVRRSNLPAIALYQSFGFREVGVRRRYYENGEDALLMVRSLSTDPVEEKP